MPVRLKSNRLPRIISQLPDAVDDGVLAAGNALIAELKGGVWKRWGGITSSVKQEKQGLGHTIVGVGGWAPDRGGAARGFYAGYQEFGTSKQGARPVVVPAAHAFEGDFGTHVGEEVRKVVR